MIYIKTGALVGAVVGDSSDWAKTGAVYGGVSGVATTDSEIAVGGPRRIIDRCMTERGHKYSVILVRAEADTAKDGAK